MSSTDGLWAGERLEVHDGTEVLTWVDVPERPTAPPVVLLPGVGHLGRIFYGHPDGDPDDFLAHRLVAAGHPVVALSYPLVHPAFSHPRPDLTMAGWARALAAATAAALADRRLGPDVVVTAWSGAGGVAARIGPALRAHGVEPQLLVALVASPPVLGLSPGWDEYPLEHRTEDGLVGLDGLAGWFDASLAAVNRRAGREVLSVERYRRDHQGAFPVALCVTELRHRPGVFVADRGEAADDLASAEVRSMPLVAVVRDTEPTDPGHALRDRWTWSPYPAAWLLEQVADRLPDGDDPRLGRPAGPLRRARRPPGAHGRGQPPLLPGRRRSDDRDGHRRADRRGSGPAPRGRSRHLSGGSPGHGIGRSAERGTGRPGAHPVPGVPIVPRGGGLAASGSTVVRIAPPTDPGTAPVPPAGRSGEARWPSTTWWWWGPVRPGWCSPESWRWPTSTWSSSSADRTSRWESSRAGGLHARTIEVLDQRGIAERFLDAGQAMQVQAFAMVPLDISDLPSRHPHGLALWQREVEPLLAGWVDELGVPVLRQREVTAVAQDDEGVDVEVSDGTALRCRYAVGCDGGRSTVRRDAGIDAVAWEATTSWLVAEVELDDEPEPGMRWDDLGSHGGSRISPDGPFRLVLTERDLRAGDPDVGDLRAALIDVYGTDLGLRHVHWVSRFTDAARQATSYRAGRLLLAGDAAHVHSPTAARA